MSSLVLVHGWGFDASFWGELSARLPECATLAFELGFLGAPRQVMAPTDGKTVAIGHSTGLLWLLHERPFAWDALVAINGFPRFISGDGFAPAVEPRVLERMLSRFDREPQAVSADFLGRCGRVDALGSLDIPTMRAGLEWLRDWDVRDSLDREASPILVLAGSADPIVPPPMTRASFGGRAGVSLRWREGGGHLLPLTDPDWCAAEIRAFLMEPES